MHISHAQDDKEYLARFTGFNLASKLATEKTIEERGNSCDEGDPIIQYDRCSQDFIKLWQEAGKSMDNHVRRKGPAVVPANTALVWPGLSLSHFLQESIPAWSYNSRNLTQVHLNSQGAIVVSRSWFYYTSPQLR